MNDAERRAARWYRLRGWRILAANVSTSPLIVAGGGAASASTRTGCGRRQRNVRTVIATSAGRKSSARSITATLGSGHDGGPASPKRGRLARAGGRGLVRVECHRCEVALERNGLVLQLRGR